MKRKIMLTVLASLCLLQVNAQQSTNFFFRERGQSKGTSVTNRLLRLQADNTTAQKPTGIKQRVMAQVSDPEFFGTDSTRFTYTGAHGSVYDFDNLEYNYADYFTSEYEPMFMSPFEANDSHTADSIIKYDEDGAYLISKAFYRADKKIDSIWEYALNGTLFTGSKVINVYNGQGYIMASYNLQQNSTLVWDTVSYRHFSYNNTFTRMDRDSTWVGINPILNGENIYYYSTNTQPDSVVAWDLQGVVPVRDYAYHMTYDGAGQLSTLRDYEFDSGTPVLYSLDSLGYTSGIGYFTFFEESAYADDTLFEGIRLIKFVNAGGLVDSIIPYFKPGASSPWGQQGKLTYFYNSYSNPEKLVISFSPGGIADDADYNFYYETYDDEASSIRPVTRNQDFSIYPNPFRNNITIDWKAKQQSAVTLRLVNVLGQEVYSASMKWNTGKHTLELPALNSGTYILVIRDADGKSWSSKILRR